LDEFWNGRPGMGWVEPELMAEEIFLPSLKADSLPKIQAALRKSYKFRERTFSQQSWGVTIHSPHCLTRHDLLVITMMAGVKSAAYADKNPRRRHVIKVVLNGRLTVDEVMNKIDGYMK